jgi:hypothetical protein
MASLILGALPRPIIERLQFLSWREHRSTYGTRPPSEHRRSHSRGKSRRTK